jgi:FlaA1/EpsC-like NDP-sugar epimerase
MTASAFWKGKRVFVTDATGIVGSWAAKDLLEAGAEYQDFFHWQSL